MKLTKYLLIAGTALLFTACVNDAGGGSSEADASFSSNEVCYTVPDDVKSISFPSSANGKKCFVIYSNEKFENQYNTRDSVKFNIDDIEEKRSAENEPELKVYEKAIKFSDGFYRDEIYFNTKDFPKYNLNNSRTARAVIGAGEENYYNKHTPEDNKSKFWVYSKNSKNVDEETFELIGESSKKHCRIWFCKNTIVDKSTLSFNSLATAFDEVFEKETAIFGNNGVDGSAYAITCEDGQMVDVLVYDIFGDANDKQTGGVFGYFRAYDFYQNKDLEKQKKAKTSNECQVISVDSFFLLKDQEGYEDPSTKETVKTNKVESTIIHEFQHLLNYCNKSDNYDTWFTEMLSMVAEDIFQNKIGLSDNDSPKSRISFTFDQPYKGFKNWPEDTDDENVHYSYANAYAFGAYLLRNYGGIELIHEIATNEYVDEAAITNALYMLGYDETFDSVFQKFGMVYIFTEENTPYSLNKSFNDNYKGVNYNITGVNLNDYPFIQFNSEETLLSYVRTNLYYDENTKYWKDLCCLLGPRIFNSSYIMIDPIEPYGFTVYYAGEVKSGKNLKIKRKSALSVTVVLK